MSRFVRTAALVSAGALVLSACGGSEDPAAGTTDTSAAPTGIAVVASTNVWADVASVIGGDRVQVAAIIDDASADPHSFEVGAQDQLAVSKAQLLVVNGGHYDDFMDGLISASGSTAPVVDAVEAAGISDGHSHADGHDHADDHAEEATESGHEGHAHGEVNEHLWYDPHLVGAVAEAIEHELVRLDPDGADTFAANLSQFLEGVEALEARASELAEQVRGEGVAVTEPLPLYLLELVGLQNLTPAEFSNAIEGDTDVPAAVLAETLDLFEAGQVAVLVYNDQTASPQTEQVRAAAEAAGVPVIGMAETLPEDQTYLTWMSSNLDALTGALTA